MMAILEAMLINKMIITSAGGTFGFGASATTGPDSPGIDEKELAAARDLGKRVTEVAGVNKTALAQVQLATRSTGCAVVMLPKVIGCGASS
jgi:hypothetical protein